MSGRTRLVLLAAVLLAAAFVPAAGSVGADAPPVGPRSLRDDAGRPTERARQMAAELRELEDAWARGGGTYGYPFWEKAGHRWRTGRISAPMYREYVTGYRDRLVPGCGLLRRAELDTRVGGVVRRLLLDACELRVEALRAQQRALDDRIRQERVVPEAGSEQVEDAEDLEQLDELEQRIARHEEEANASLQQSYRAARLALDHAQAALDAAKLSRLAEDAFI